MQDKQSKQEAIRACMKGLTISSLIFLQQLSEEIGTLTYGN